MSNFKFGKVKPDLKLDKLPPTGKVTYRSPWLTGKVCSGPAYNVEAFNNPEYIAKAKEFWAKFNSK
jgi:hypothetical protein